MDALLNILDPLYFYLDLTTNYGTIVQIKNTCTETHAAISAYEIKYKHYLLSLPLGRGLTIKFGVKAVNVYEDPRAPPVRRCIHAVVHTIAQDVNADIRLADIEPCPEAPGAGTEVVPVAWRHMSLMYLRGKHDNLFIRFDREYSTASMHSCGAEKYQPLKFCEPATYGHYAWTAEQAGLCVSPHEVVLADISSMLRGIFGRRELRLACATHYTQYTYDLQENIYRYGADSYYFNHILLRPGVGAALFEQSKAMVEQDGLPLPAYGLGFGRKY
jgi:hypothetical protein